MPFLNPKLGIDFSDYIADRTLNFTGREWVFEAIRNWLAKPEGDRFFLLTGEPGSGKTAIAARLTQFAQGIETCLGLKAGFLQAIHFCSARDSVWIDPKEFARSLALQLAANIPEFGLALKDIGEKTTNINVDLKVGTAQNSDIKGVNIQNLTLSGLTGQEAFTQVVINPLRQIHKEEFSQPVTILVDSLDEALAHVGDNTIVGLLSKLSSDTKVRLILTSRNESRIKDKFSSYKELFLSSIENFEQNQRDVKYYIEQKIRQDKSLQSFLKTQAINEETLIRILLERSEANFLYVRFLLESFTSGQQSVANIDSLPHGLDDLYYNSLERIVQIGKKNWTDSYAPLMGVLLAAQESLTESQIRAFTNLKESEVWACLNDLRQFLDELESEGEETRYKLYHQSVIDFLGKRKLLICEKKQNNLYYLPTQEQHQLITGYYKPSGKSWSEVKLEQIDSYGRRYLPQHLVKADQVEELHLLLSLEKNGKNAWFKLKDDEGETADFLTDVELAWSKADELYEHEPGISVGLQCRYALIEASVNSLANIPEALMVALVRQHYWKPAKALAYIRRIQDPKKKCESLAALANELSSSDPLNFQVLQLALESALQIDHEIDRAKALLSLIDKLPEALPKTLEAIDKPSGKYRDYRAEILMALEGKLPDALSKALEAALAIQEISDRARVLTVLADKIPEALPKALEVALNIENPSIRASALIELAPKLTISLVPKILEAAPMLHEGACMLILVDIADKLSPNLLPKALEITFSLQDKYYYARCLIALADKLPEVLPKALEVTPTIQFEYHRVEVFMALADKLPEALPKALEAALAIQDASNRAKSLTLLADKLPEVLPKALEAALAIQEASARAESLTILADKLPEALPKALEAALAIQDNDTWQGIALGKLAPKLIPSMIPKVLEAQAIRSNDFYRDRVITASVERLSPDLFPKALEAVQSIQDRMEQVQALMVLANQIDPNLSSKALETALLIKDEIERVQSLVELADKLPEAVPKALEIALSIENESNRCSAFYYLIPKIHPSRYSEILASVQTMQKDYNRCNLLKSLVPKLTPDLLPKALEIAQAIPEHSSRSYALIALLSKMPEVLSKALDAVLAIQNGVERHKALKRLTEELPLVLPYSANYLTMLIDKLPPTSLKGVLQTSLVVQDASNRAYALTALNSKLPAALPLALEAALTIQDDKRCAEALVALVDKLPKNLVPKVLEEFLEYWHRRVSSVSQSTGNKIQTLFGTLLNRKPSEVQSEPSYREALSSLLKTLPLEVALTIQDEWNRTHAIAALANKLTPNLLPKALEKALETALSVQDGNRRTYLITVLANKLTPDLIPQAFEAVLAIGINEKYHNPQLEAFLALANNLTPDLIPKAFEIVLAMKIDEGLLNTPPVKALTALASKVTPELLPRTLEAVLAMPFDSDKKLVLTALAGKIPLDLLPTVLEAAVGLKVYHRQKLFASLVPHLVNHSDRFNLWKNSLHSLSNGERPELLRNLSVLIPAITVLGGEAAAVETAQAIQDVSRWWP